MSNAHAHNILSPTEDECEDFQLIQPLLPSPTRRYSCTQVNIVREETLTVQTEQIVTFPREDHVTEAKRFLRGQLSSVRAHIEDILYRVEEIDRDPGFVIDLLILIPESNRNVKRSILSALGNLVRAYPHLLFDFRIVKREGRERSTVIPEGYTT